MNFHSVLLQFIKHSNMAFKAKRNDLRIIIEDSNIQTPHNISVNHFEQNNIQSDNIHHQDVPLYNSEILQGVQALSTNHYHQKQYRIHDEDKIVQKQMPKTDMLMMARKLDIQAVESRLNENVHSVEKSMSRGSYSKSVKHHSDYYQVKNESRKIQNKRANRSKSINTIGNNEQKCILLNSIIQKLSNKSTKRYNENIQLKNRKRNFKNIKKQLIRNEQKKSQKLESNRITTKLNRLQKMLHEIKETKKQSSRVLQPSIIHQAKQKVVIQKKKVLSKTNKNRNKSLAKISEQLKLAKNDLEQAQKKNYQLIKQVKNKRDKSNSSSYDGRYSNRKNTTNNEFDKKSPIGMLNYNFSREEMQFSDQYNYYSKKGM